MIQTLLLLLIGFQSSPTIEDVGLFAKTLWFVQAYGNADSVSARSDRLVKNTLAKSLANDRKLSVMEIGELIGERTFAKFAGSDNLINDVEITSALEAATPASRLLLLPSLHRHADFLTTTFDMIETDHLDAMDKLADWLVENWKPDQTLDVLATCTGNSRRSILGACMGNMAAHYYGLENIRFHSGGTAPSAFNARTIATLKEIGFEIEPTGMEAVRGDPKTPNKIYRVSLGKGIDFTEFSKSYQDEANPQSGFAAVLVCNDADAECPTVTGAAVRISMTFIDPKLYDDGAFETKKYAERRDDIGRTFLAVLASVRRRLHER